MSAVSAAELLEAYRQGASAAADPRAVNPYAPAPDGDRRQLLARMWLRGRLRHALDVPD